jgi:hypothetical protein
LPASGSRIRPFSRLRWFTKPIFASRISLASGIGAGISLPLPRWRCGAFWSSALATIDASSMGPEGEHVEADEGIAGADPDLTNVLAIDEALSRLESTDPRKAKIVTLRYFAGLSIEETASALDLSPATVKNEWTFARAWLFRVLGSPEVHPTTVRHDRAREPQRKPSSWHWRTSHPPIATHCCRSAVATIRVCARRSMRCSTAIEAPG